MQDQPIYIKIHENDNAAIVVNSGGVPAGAVFGSGLIALRAIPQAHKIALEDIAKGGEIRRYDQVIGYAVRDIAKGDWIEGGLMELPAAPPLEDMPLATGVPAPKEAITGRTFLGYRNADGTTGTRNLLALIPSVQCVAGFLSAAERRIREELLPAYPNVDGVVALNHAYGCGVAIDAPDAVVPIRTLQNLARNPNFGGEAIIVGLGCEKLAPERMAPQACPANLLMMQDYHGFGDMMRALLCKAEEHLARLNRREREERPVSELVVGLQCGGSDAFSGVTGNPAVGHAADLLVRCGATVAFSEVTEVRDAVHLLTPRAISREAGLRLIGEMRWYDNYLARGGVNRSSNTTPGNKEGGLGNIVEKALGSIAKSGSAAISGVISPGESLRGHKGLVYVATSASDFVCGTSQAASGITLQVFITGRGTPYGLAMLPVLKVASRTDLAAQWFDLIDVDAGRIATGKATIPQIGEEIFELILDTASGRYIPWSDRWGLYNDLCVFNPAPIT